MNLDFPQTFKELDKREEFSDVFYTIDNVKVKSKVNIHIIGPFLFFLESKSSDPLFMIFIEHFQAGKVSNSSDPAITMRSSYEDHIYYLYFKTSEQVNTFLISYYTNMALSSNFFSNIQCDQIDVADMLYGYFSNHNSILKSNCVLLRKSNSAYFFQAHGFDKNNIFTCLFDFQFDKFSFVTPLLSAPTVFSQKNIPTVNYFMLCDVHNPKTFSIFQCSSLSQCVRWILSIHSWFKIFLRNQSFSSPLKASAISLPKTSDIKIKKSADHTPQNDKSNIGLSETKPHKSTNLSKIAESENLFKDILITSEDVKIPSPTSLRETSSEKAYDLNPFEIFSSTMTPPNSPAHSPFSRFSLSSSPKSIDDRNSSIISQNPSNDSLAATTPVGGNRSPSVTRRSIKATSPTNKTRGNRIKNESISQSSSKADSLIVNDQQIQLNEKKLKKNLEEARRFNQQTRKEEFSFPPESNQIISSQLFSEEKYVKNQIKLALNLFMSSDNYINSSSNSQNFGNDDNSEDGTSETNDDSTVEKDRYDFSYSEDVMSSSQINYSFLFNQFEPCDLRSNDEIFDSLLIGVKEQKMLNEIVKENLQLNFFPSFDFKKLYDADKPYVSILVDITATTQEIQTQFIENKIDSIHTDRLCFLISALLINGMKGFQSFRSKIDFLSPFTEISSHVGGLFQICERVEENADKNNLLSSQLSLFTVELLNHQVLLPLLHSILEIDDWTNKYYNKNSYMHDDETIENICLILEGSISKLTFEIPFKDSIIATASADDKKNYIFTQPFSYLDCIDISFQDNINVVKNKVCSYFVNLFYEGCIKKNPWTFLCEIADSNHVKNNSEFISFSSYVKKLPWKTDEQTKIDRIIKHALRLNVLHTWFAFMFTNQRIANTYYRPDSVFCDLYRAKFVFSFILKYQNCFNRRL